MFSDLTLSTLFAVVVARGRGGKEPPPCPGVSKEYMHIVCVSTEFS